MKRPAFRRGDALRVDTERLWARHMEMAQIGAIAGDGNSRLALSDEDNAARGLFARWCREAGLELRSDRAGNMFALRAGSDPRRPAVATGSHLDTQPRGGRFDGISGVLAGLEVIETLNDAGIATEAPLAVVNWTNEEGVRFAPGLLGSAWFAGTVSDAELGQIRAADGALFADEVRRSGWAGDTRPGDLPLDSFFELHIEQGPILEREAMQVGVVSSVQGLRWLDVSVGGKNGHAGTTPLDARQDALLAAAAMVVGLNRAGLAAGREARVSVGRFVPATDGPSTIVAGVDFVVDIRHPDDRALAGLAEEAGALCQSIAVAHGCRARVTERIAIPPRRMDRGCVAAVAQAARALGYRHRELSSGALHDAANIAATVPAAMIFVPCRDGISHNVAEYAAPEDLARGADVLLHAMLDRAGVARRGQVASA